MRLEKILFACVLLISVVLLGAYAEEQAMLNNGPVDVNGINLEIMQYEKQITEYEQKRAEENEYLSKISDLHEDCLDSAKDFKKDANKALKVERDKIREQMDRINALLKKKTSVVVDSCKPGDPDCIDCRAYKGVCFRGHCCS